MRWLALAFAALVVAWLAASAFLFVWPSQDAPGRASAVVVLAGGKDRLPKALKLMGAGVARTLVIDRNRPHTQPEEVALCSGRPVPFAVICMEMQPYSTRGEAETVARLAARRHWGALVVVTSSYHVTRARMIFHRCDRKVRVVGSNPGVLALPIGVASEWVKLIYALTVKRSC